MNPELKLVRQVAEMPGTTPDAAEAPTDDFLMMAAAGGRESAFGELVERYQGAVRRFCVCLLGEDHLAREAAQDVFLQVWTARDRYRPQGRFKSFLFTVARNQCRSVLRKRRLRALVGLDREAQSRPPRPDAIAREPTDQTDGPEQSALRAERAAIVAAALARLPEKFRVPLAMRFAEHMPYEEIARVIDRTPSTARSRVHYGLKELAKLLPEEVVR